MRMEMIRATRTAEQAGAYYVRIQAMARKHRIPLDVEFDEQDTPQTKYVGKVIPHAVLESYRIQTIEQWAMELGYQVAVVESRDNKIPFYEAQGYVADYSRKIVGETFTCFRMEKKLG